MTIEWEGKYHEALTSHLGRVVPLSIGRHYDPDPIVRRPKRVGRRKDFRKYKAVMEGEKICRICGKKKHVTEFHRDAIQRDGRRNNCAECKSARDKEKYKK